MTLPTRLPGTASFICHQASRRPAPRSAARRGGHRRRRGRVHRCPGRSRRLLVEDQRLGHTIRQVVAALRGQCTGGEGPAQLLRAGLGVTAADLVRQALQGEQLVLEQRDIGEIDRQCALAAQFRWRHRRTALAEHHAVAFALPGAVLVAHLEQATALALGGQPQLLAIGADGNAFVERIELHQQAAGASLAQQALRQRQPARLADGGKQQDGRVAFADHIAVARLVAADASKSMAPPRNSPPTATRARVPQDSPLSGVPGTTKGSAVACQALPGASSISSR